MADKGIRHLAVLVMLVMLVTLAIGTDIATAKIDHTKYDKVRECISCHPRTDPTHWQQRPSSMQSLLPLDKRGRMICTTCHICTRETCDLRETKEDLCKTCHDCSQGMACMIGAAHLGDAKNLKELAIDSCLNCHDKEGTPETCSVGNRTIHTTAFKSKSPDAVTRNVTLIDGEITCLSCHNPYTTAEFAKLVKPDRGEHLCTACHGKLTGFDHTRANREHECITCHPRAKPSHTQQKPTFMKAELPLDEDGRMLCITCHICVNKTCAIRGKKEEICQVCHDCTKGMSCMIGTPHLADSRGKKEAAKEACLECHDSTVSATTCKGADGNDITERMKRTGETCLSCHDPYKTDKTTMEGIDRGKIGTDKALKNSHICPRKFKEFKDERECRRCHPV